jgi:hypothetical protein
MFPKLIAQRFRLQHFSQSPCAIRQGRRKSASAVCGKIRRSIFHGNASLPRRPQRR